MFYPLKVVPVYKDYIWGGRNLEKYRKNLPNGIIAESWELSCLNDGLSIVSNGSLRGKALRDVIFSNKDDYLGKNYSGAEDIFPLLFKIIDAQDDLSIQVHPDDKYAHNYENGQYGKTEMWYILEAKKDASIILGFQDNLEESYIKNSIKNNNQNGLYNEVKVEKGDVIYIPSGTVHAIKSGLLIAEIQQSSNLTYRIYDYNRELNGKKRELHIEKAIDVINSKSKCYIHNGLRVKNKNIETKILSVSDYFYISEITSNNSFIDICTEDCFNVLMALDGQVYIEFDNGKDNFKSIETVFIPAKLGRYRLSGTFKILWTSIPKISVSLREIMNDIGFKYS